MIYESFGVSWIENGSDGRAHLGFISDTCLSMTEAKKELERIRERDQVACAWIDRYGRDGKKIETPVHQCYINIFGDREMWRFQKPKQTTFKDRFDKVIQSGNYGNKQEKVEALAKLIYANDRSRAKEDCLAQALDEYESMTGSYWDPTHQEYAEALASII